ncbi:hypothetical protein Salat_0646300 [Sesamum alatum]|uniref:Uncharacterized protein n=1 Tax=Sesamum alatum TaxID=300844 RepID=A0AAE1YQP9_9LAMI|nr:hypothetical protein Salat_0646300 [Sesamum alatum]
MVLERNNPVTVKIDAADPFDLRLHGQVRKTVKKSLKIVGQMLEEGTRRVDFLTKLSRCRVDLQMPKTRLAGNNATKKNEVLEKRLVRLRRENISAESKLEKTIY